MGNDGLFTLIPGCGAGFELFTGQKPFFRKQDVITPRYVRHFLTRGTHLVHLLLHHIVADEQVAPFERGIPQDGICFFTPGCFYQGNKPCPGRRKAIGSEKNHVRIRGSPYAHAKGHQIIPSEFGVGAQSSDCQIFMKMFQGGQQHFRVVFRIFVYHNNFKGFVFLFQ